MELKKFQKRVLGDLSDYLEQLRITKNIEDAYARHWENNNMRVGGGGLPRYNNTIPGVPHVCFKVPTGGGKTFLACASIKSIFDSVLETDSKVVVWLVPSNSIMEQTIKNLKDPYHPYRQKLELDFNSRVEIYTKDELLNGQNFNPSAIKAQLSICILSFDSLRSMKKDGRKVYQENGNLEPFVKTYQDANSLIKEIDPTALIQVLNQQNPVVIVDESHNAQSTLSVEMLTNLNPSFILDLTATPRKNSNIISYVGASELKRENMVKLPVIVYNRSDRQDVLTDAIMLRGRIEFQALEEEKITGTHIRPIILFQAQPKTGEDSQTFLKLKEWLIEMDIPEEQIAIKTSEINEIKNVDLLSKDCEIRYIITVNALKEGWDCPFAYILATLANKTSAVDVEQILGRILRQPYTIQHSQPLLNMSYVLTCSNDFRSTLDNIVDGLNEAGFSRKDFRVGSNEGPSGTLFDGVLIPLEGAKEGIVPDVGDTASIIDGVNSDKVKEAVESSQINHITPGSENSHSAIDKMVKAAEDQGIEFAMVAAEDQQIISPDIAGLIPKFEMNDLFRDQISELRIPQFFLKKEPSMFSVGDTTLLTKEALSYGFKLSNKDISINFETADSNIYKVDVESSGDTTPKYEKLNARERNVFKGYFDDYVTPSDIRLSSCKKEIHKILNRMDSIATSDLVAYTDRVIESLSKDNLVALMKAPQGYARKIKEKIQDLEDEYREDRFYKMLDSGEIVCKKDFKLPCVIHPMNASPNLGKSLYNSEEDMNELEFRIISNVISLENVKWWHRIIDRDKSSYHINGAINHYPDFMVMTERGNLVLIETKGADRDNTDSRRKLKLGKAWQNCAGPGFKFFLVVEGRNFDIEGAYQIDDFIDVMRKL